MTARPTRFATPGEKGPELPPGYEHINDAIAAVMDCGDKTQGPESGASDGI